jgi:general secretion pathway protein D
MKKIAVILALALALTGCASISRSYRLGTAAEMNKQYDMAIKYYEQASLENPKESVYRLALFRVKASASLYHLRNARTMAAQGNKKDARAEYGLALAYDPGSRTIAAELRALDAPAVKPAKPAAEMPGAPVKLKGSGEKLSVDFRTPVSLKSILATLGRTSGVTFIYDETYRDINLAVDLTGKELEQAVNYLCIASKNFYRVVDEKTAIIAPDNFTMRQKYELLVIRTFYLSNINAQDVQLALVNMIKTQTKIPTIQIDKSLNSITIRDTPQAVALAEKLLKAWDKSQAEVIIDVEIMEVDRTMLRKIGIDLSQGIAAIRLNPASTTTDGTSWIKLSDIKLGDLSSWEITTPQAVLQFLEGDANTKIIAQPRIRGVAGEEMKYLVGQKVPIPNSTFTPIMAGGANAQPIVQYTQTDVGIELKMKPRIHLEKEVTIEVEIKVSAISGSGIAGIPIIATREIKNTIRLKDGEPNLLAGLLRDEERKTISGITGLKDIPILGHLFASTETQIDQTDVILTITPYIIRTIPLTDEDAKPVWVDPNNMAGVSSAGQAGGLEGISEEAGIPEAQAPEPEEDAGANAVYLSPANFEVPKDREFRVNVELASEKDIGNMSLNLAFDPQSLKLKEVIEGGVAKQLGGQAKFLSIPSSSGCTLGFSAPSLGRGFKGQGILAVLVFTAVNPGETAISIGSYSAVGVNGQAVVLGTGESRILIR